MLVELVNKYVKDNYVEQRVFVLGDNMDQRRIGDGSEKEKCGCSNQSLNQIIIRVIQVMIGEQFFIFVGDSYNFYCYCVLIVRFIGNLMINFI